MSRFQISIPRKQCVYGLMTLALWLCAQTGSAEELSSGKWQSILAAGGEYSARNGSETMRVRQHADGELLALARGVTAQEIPVGAAVVSTEQRGSGPALLLATVFKHDGVTRILAVSAATRNGGGALTLAHIVDPKRPRATERVSEAGAALLMSAMKGESVATSPIVAKTKPRTSPPPAASVKSGSGPRIERMVFDLDYLYGVGGGAYPEYTPVVLFGDGTACKCLEAAIDDIDVGKIQKQKPKRVGNWRKSGGDYEVRWTGAAQPEILKINVGAPTDLPDSGALRGRYQHISGGGNTALGGTVTVASAEDLTFYDDGSFSQAHVTFALSTAVTSSTKRGKTGSWSLDDSTLTLRYGDGNTVRTTVFYSPKRKSSADFGRYGVLWIGGEGFKRVE